MDTKINMDNMDNKINMDTSINKDIIKGWEYLTDIKPTDIMVEQKLQDSYLMHYNLAYHTFLKSLCIDKEELDIIVNDLKYKINATTGQPITKYRFIVDVNDENNNNIINDDNNYPIKFLKSKFLEYKSKKIKKDLITYYKPLNFYVKGPFEILINKKINKYFIELCWNNNN